MTDTKILRAQEIEVPEQFIEKLNDAGKGSGTTWQEVLTEAGELHRMDVLTMAAAWLFPFKRILEMAVRENDNEFDLDTFEGIYFGFGISYLTGMGEWDDTLPIFVPDLDVNMVNFERVVSRTGKEYTVMQMMEKVYDIVKTLDLPEVMDETYPKGKFTKRSTDNLKKPHLLLKALATMFAKIDRDL